MGVNNAFVLQMPYNVPKLLQVIGRVVRNKSHVNLPVDSHFVNVHLLVNVMHETTQQIQSSDIKTFLSEQTPLKSKLYGVISRDQLFYFKRFNEYMLIQDYEQILHQCARDVGMYGQLYFKHKRLPNNDVQFSLNNELRLKPFSIQKLTQFDDTTHTTDNPYYLSFYRLRY